MIQRLTVRMVIASLMCVSASAAVIINVPTEPIPFFNNPRIDIDGNGTDDFRFGGLPNASSVVITERANRYLGTPAIPPNSGGSPAALLDNTMIGGNSTPSGLVFLSSDSADGFVSPDQNTGLLANLFLCVSTGCSGEFLGEPGFTQRALLGVEFEAEDGIHFGYFDIETSVFRDSVILGFAYETEPNTPILATFVPEPSSAMLVLGSLILGLRRKQF